MFVSGVGSVFKKRFSSFLERAKYSTGINREIDITPKCPCEKRAGQKVLLKARDGARGPGRTCASSRVTALAPWPASSRAARHPGALGD